MKIIIIVRDQFIWGGERMSTLGRHFIPTIKINKSAAVTSYFIVIISS